MYADTADQSMQQAIDRSAASEPSRWRYNEAWHWRIKKEIRDLIGCYRAGKTAVEIESLNKQAQGHD